MFDLLILFWISRMIITIVGISISYTKDAPTIQNGIGSLSLKVVTEV